jgi:hypothetical protein
MRLVRSQVAADLEVRLGGQEGSVDGREELLDDADLATSIAGMRTALLKIGEGENSGMRGEAERGCAKGTT